MWKGRLLSIHTTGASREPIRELDRATLIAGVGIEGDRYAKGIDTGTYSKIPDVREVTLIEVETLEALARDHDITLTPQEHRRNLTVRGVPLNHLVGVRFRVGEVVLEGGRLNTPCRYLDMITRKSVCDLMVHRSGLNCRIVEGGTIRPGDTVQPA
ncbi:MOSC domain-containing protein [Sulfitobacter sp. D35]|uniref:MOSC domain-containing protein n=1 Tax=Sulfitobacter sp. D35 TaxID=3083252 RepID=UPI00296F9F4A|nr:MOSC domain-containing protein [Sulfitobacter sp. D35]MDW4497592.1 MOSC domain-containing protein [Sulfitobacter sp. D35]